MILASDFSALIYLLGFPPAGLFILLGLLSFVPAKSGFKSDLVLSLIAAIGGALLTVWIALEPRQDHLMPSMWAIFPASIPLGLLSLALWKARDRKKRQLTQTESSKITQTTPTP